MVKLLMQLVLLPAILAAYVVIKSAIKNGNKKPSKSWVFKQLNSLVYVQGCTTILAASVPTTKPKKIVGLTASGKPALYEKKAA